MKILVGLSGGVDSTVAALLLKEQGHEIIGATMSLWDKNDPTPRSGQRTSCYSPDEIEDINLAEKIAKTLSIPFHVIDCSKGYKDNILNDFKTEYLNGRTPNPCIKCNPKIKFGLFPQLARESGIEFDKFATGHYARIEKGENGRYILKSGILPQKDQSYFLYRLSQDQLANTIMPLGGYTKEEIRKIAANYGLEVAQKPDSQDFYNGDYNELLGVEEVCGNIINTDGKILGKHNGIWNYTIGQRKGLGISAPEPLYVLELKKDTNEVVVGYADKTFRRGLIATDINWISTEQITDETKVLIKIRSTQRPFNGVLIPQNDGKIRVMFEDLQKSVAPGQSAVFYNNDILLGGGFIESAI
ncbi:MAG: tRNA 2-thiouridine(34) synthase MnmA [bacterium]|nr:tRNA 2-thiouridine(34) synthase MnmA [bacterium]